MATVTNSICTNNNEIDIQSNGGNINIGTNISSTSITIGNATSTTGIIVNLGSLGFKIPSFNTYGSLFTTSSGNVSIISAGIVGSVITSNGSSNLPSYKNIPISVDGITISDQVFVNTGSTLNAGAGPRGMTSYIINGNQYISVVASSVNTFSTYVWNGTTFVSIGASVATGNTPIGITSYVIGGTQYISVTNSASNTFSTYSWNGTAFVSIGAAVATGTVPAAMTSYIISGTQYISIINTTSATIGTYSWNGTTFVSIGVAISGGSTSTNHNIITSYIIGSTQYISVAVPASNLFGTYSWNGTTFISAGTTSSTLAQGITSYSISGTPYISVTNTSANTFSTYSWNGSSYVPVGLPTPTYILTQYITSYVIGGTQYISVTNNTSNTFSTYSWNGTAFVSIGAAVATGTLPTTIISYNINNNPYISLISSAVVNTYSMSNILSMKGVFNAGISTNPVNSSIATATFITSMTSGTSYQNTTGYDVLINICVSVNSATNGVINLGVGIATAPTINIAIRSFTSATAVVKTFQAIVPNNYFVRVTATGTISVASINVQSCAM